MEKKLLEQIRMEGGNQFVKTKEIKKVRKFQNVKETERNKHKINKKISKEVTANEKKETKENCTRNKIE